MVQTAFDLLRGARSIVEVRKRDGTDLSRGERYPSELKELATRLVSEVRARDRSSEREAVDEVAQQLGLSSSTLRAWVRQDGLPDRVCDCGRTIGRQSRSGRCQSCATTAWRRRIPSVVTLLGTCHYCGEPVSGYLSSHPRRTDGLVFCPGGACRRASGRSNRDGRTKVAVALRCRHGGCQRTTVIEGRANLPKSYDGRSSYLCRDHLDRCRGEDRVCALRDCANTFRWVPSNPRRFCCGDHWAEGKRAKRFSRLCANRDCVDPLSNPKNPDRRKRLAFTQAELDKGRKFCSHSCAAHVMRRKPKTCEGCGTLFRPTRDGQRFHTIACFNRSPKKAGTYANRLEEHWVLGKRGTELAKAARVSKRDMYAWGSANGRQVTKRPAKTYRSMSVTRSMATVMY
jgi:hypothetical protein